MGPRVQTHFPFHKVDEGPLALQQVSISWLNFQMFFSSMNDEIQ